MTLRTRLLLGYGYLVVLILAVAGTSAVAFLHLSSGIDVVLDENFRSIRASMEMIESLERQDSETLAALLEGDVDRDALGRLETSFEEAFRVARGNVTEPEEPLILERIERDLATFIAARNALIEERPEAPLAAYNRRVFPLFSRIKSEVLHLLEINQEAMVQADREARQTAHQAGAVLGVLVAVGLVSFILLARVMQRTILGRIDELKRGVEAIATRDPRRRLREEGADELTVVARRINELLDRHQRAESRLEGHVRQERQLVLGLVERFGPEATVYGLAGNRVAGSDDVDPAVRRWIRSEGRTRLEKWEPDAEAIEERVAGEEGPAPKVRLLTVSGVRPVGWLVEWTPEG